MNNLYTGMLQGLDPATQGLVQALSAQRQQPKEVTVRTAQMPASIEANNLQRHQDYTDDVRNDLTGLSPGMGNFAPLAGVLKAYARARYDKGADATQEQLSEKVRASLEAEQAQAAAAAQAERERKKADELAKREYELEQWQREQAAARQAQQAGFAHDRNMQGMKQQATGPTQQEQVAQIMQMPDGPEKRQAMLLVAPELVKDQDAQAAASQMQDKVAQENKNAAGLVDYLLAPENAEALQDATGSLEGGFFGTAKNALFNQDAVSWRNQYEGLSNLLTLDNLDRMTGVLSESDIKILSSAAMNGLDTTSDEGLVRDQLGALQRYYQAIGAGGDPQGGAQTSPSSSGGGLTPEEQQELDMLRQKLGANPNG